MKTKKILTNFNWGIMYFYDCTDDEFIEANHMEKIYLWRWFTLTLDWKNPSIWIKDNDIPTIVHECMHATFHIANQMWIEYCSESEEFFTYMTEYFIREILKITK